MLVDPEIHRGAPKMMRYDGVIVPGNPYHVSPSVLDPRNKLLSPLWKIMGAMDLPVPRFKAEMQDESLEKYKCFVCTSLKFSSRKHFIQHMAATKHGNDKYATIGSVP